MRLPFALLLAVVVLCLFAQPGAAAAQERRVALIVGNGGYRHVTALPNPTRDARLMAATARSLGFEVVGGDALLDLDQAAFEAAIKAFRRALRPGTVAMFYYAGHGVQVDGQNLLIPVGADPATVDDVAAQGISAATVLQTMAQAGSSLNIVMLDACRDNPFAAMMAGPAGRGLRAGASSSHRAHVMSTGLAEMHAPRGTLISYATQIGSVAQDGVAGADSPYATALSHAMRRPDLDVVGMFNAAGIEVEQLTHDQQEPWLAFSPIAHPVFLAGGAGSVSAPVPMHPAPVAPAVATAAPPACPPAGTEAVRSGGGIVRYQGEDSPGICVQIVRGVAEARGYGLWPANWDGAARAAEAMRTVLAGPAGASAQFSVSADVRSLRLTQSDTWQVTLHNDGPGSVMVAGRARPALRVTWKERGLSHPYLAEVDVAVDVATGAVLSQSFRLVDGNATGGEALWSRAGGGLGTVPDFSVTALR